MPAVPMVIVFSQAATPQPLWNFHAMAPTAVRPVGYGDQSLVTPDDSFKNDDGILGS